MSAVKRLPAHTATGGVAALLLHALVPQSQWWQPCWEPVLALLVTQPLLLVVAAVAAGVCQRMVAS
jgi:hypothetical protein